VIEICTQALTTDTTPDDKYWILATMAEAYLGIGDENQSSQAMSRAKEATPRDWMVASTEEQVSKLSVLLGRSPLRNLPSAGSAAN
jgi:hypothetical protein